ncbi:hypothetical protein Scep_003485 [Stephania cephalantha]|uniref:5'-nucleotidase n=1 Tax=Stephania cephalantha TaxID=152367 RepID=A0AAP0PY37_9MAGN
MTLVLSPILDRWIGKSFSLSLITYYLQCPCFSVVGFKWLIDYVDEASSYVPSHGLFSIPCFRGANIMGVDTLVACTIRVASISSFDFVRFAMRAIFALDVLTSSCFYINKVLYELDWSAWVLVYIPNVQKRTPLVSMVATSLQVVRINVWDITVHIVLLTHDLVLRVINGYAPLVALVVVLLVVVTTLYFHRAIRGTNQGTTTRLLWVMSWSWSSVVFLLPFFTATPLLRIAQSPAARKTIHTLNKNEHALDMAAPVHDQLGGIDKPMDDNASLKKRTNVLLLGDHIGDLGMSDGLNFTNRIAVGFLNDNIEKSLEKYQQAFDIVYLNDAPMWGAVELVSQLFSSGDEDH